MGMQATPQTPRIAILPELVSNQIAAGEVIERPASALKELIENSLDAGASEVRVDLEEGGVKLVRVVDDGVGLCAADLELAFEPFATSKLRDAADLEHIASLGFRGEALASIGSVARCSIVSRPAEADEALIIRNEGGRREPVRAAPGDQGTLVEVRDLFFNTPARRQFLKRPATELARCLDVLQRLALAHEGVGFVATHNGKRVFDVEAGMDLRARIRRTFGAELADSLEPVSGVDGATRLEGFVAPPRFARRDTGRQMWFLNGRFLRDKLLSRCLREAYRGWVMDGRQACAFLRLALDPAQVDVNVHPTKSEVRFRDERRMFGFLLNRLREAVAQTDVATPGQSMLATAQRRGAWSPATQPGQAPLPDPGGLRPDQPAGDSSAGGSALVREVSGPALELNSQAGAGAPASDPWAPRDRRDGPFLQIARTYLLRPLPDGFEIIDQHALHERLTLNELEEELSSGAIEVQRLLVPALVELSRDEVRLFEDHGPSLAQVGIVVEPFGPTTVAVNGLPARLRNPDPEGILRDVVAQLKESGAAPGAAEVLEHALHRAACRSSIMAGDPLTEAEIRTLLERAARFENDQTCAHGRPTRVRFTLSDLEKAFHRR